jgi:hypothetical protein
MWTLLEGIEFAKRLEVHLEPLGYHVAIGGGTLLKGSSLKDLDLFFYPHKKGEPSTKSFEEVNKSLEALGLILTRECQHLKYGDEKIVFEFALLHQRVDIFYVS